MRMQIVVDFGLGLQDYCEHFDELVIAERDCPLCQTAGSLIGNGSYPRHPLDATRRYALWVKRRYCKACHGSISFLPNFLLSFRWYLLVVIQGVVVAHFEQQWSWRQVTAKCTVAGAPSARTIRRWCRSFAAQAPAWLAPGQAQPLLHQSRRHYSTQENQLHSQNKLFFILTINLLTINNRKHFLIS